MLIASLAGGNHGIIAWAMPSPIVSDPVVADSDYLGESSWADFTRYRSDSLVLCRDFFRRPLLPADRGLPGRRGHRRDGYITIPQLI